MFKMDDKSYLSPLSQRRLSNFKKNRRAYLSLKIFICLFLMSLCSELIINDKPVITYYKGEILFPIIKDYPEERFGGFLAITDYRDPFIADEILVNFIVYSWCWNKVGICP